MLVARVPGVSLSLNPRLPCCNASGIQVEPRSGRTVPGRRNHRLTAKELGATIIPGPLPEMPTAFRSKLSSLDQCDCDAEGITAR